MHKRFPLFLLAALLMPALLPGRTPALTKFTGSKNLLFIENKGQVVENSGKQSANVLFTASGSGANIFITGNAIHYQFSARTGTGHLVDNKAMATAVQPSRSATHRFSMALVGAQLHPVVRKEQKSAYTENYYTPRYKHGLTAVASYERLVFENVYPKIDWVIYSRNGFLEYDFMVHPGGDLSRIRLKIDDADSFFVARNGGLVINTRLGRLEEHPPVSFAGDKSYETHYALNRDHSLGFTVAGKIPKHAALTIDPSVTWSTYYGGSDAEYCGYTIASDSADHVYLCGTTSSRGLAAGGYKDTLTDYDDAFLVKFDGQGNRLWATYYIGYGGDSYRAGVATDKLGNVFLYGSTPKRDGIAFNGFQNAPGGQSDAYLVKFDGNGIRQWATYFGATGAEFARAIATDDRGNVYLGGSTASAGTVGTNSNIAHNGFQNTLRGGVYDAFLVKFNANGDRIWATYYGGNSEEEFRGLATDRSGNVFCAGVTQSFTGIASGGFQNSYGGNYDGFLVKFDSSGNRQWATYYGAAGNDHVQAVATDPTGNVFLGGYTGNRDSIADNGYQNAHAGGSWDAFLVKFDGAGTRKWATYYGGSDDEYGTALVCDAGGNVYLGGQSGSTTGIDSGGWQNVMGGMGDAYLVKFNNSGKRLWASYAGGSGIDDCYALATNRQGNIYLAGTTYSTNNISLGGFQNSLAGQSDAFLLKVPDPPLIVPSGIIQARPDNNRLLVSPNPAIDELRLSAETIANVPVIIDITNLSGQKIYSETFTPGVKKWSHLITIDQAVANGAYLLNMRTKSGHLCTPLLIQR